MPTHEEQQLDERMRLIRIKEKEREVALRAQSMGILSIALERVPISFDALLVIPEAKARELKMLCILRTLKELRFAAVDPDNMQIQELRTQLEALHHLPSTVYLISEHSLEQALKLYALAPVHKPTSRAVQITEDELTFAQTGLHQFSDIAPKLTSTNVSELLVILVAGALRFRASDIHGEPTGDTVTIRYRIDGILHEVGSIASAVFFRMISRIKLLAALKINIEHVPQDGSISIRTAKEALELRVSLI